MRVTVMGLGLNGGGLASARFLLAHGARLVVTDLRDEAILRPSLDALGSGDYRTVLGRHEEKTSGNVTSSSRTPRSGRGIPG